MKNHLLFVCFSLFTATTLSADDQWPSWRGPTANGIAPANANPPLKWDEKSNIKWKAKMEGRGSATPIIWDDQIFVVTAVKTDRLATTAERPPVDPKYPTRTQPPAQFYQFKVISFDRQTGTIRWQKTLAEAVPHEGHHETHSYAAGSPATDGKHLIVSFGSFGIYALDLTGKLLWQRDLGRIHSRLGWGEAVTPVIDSKSIYLNWDQEGEGDSRLIALNLETGKTKWEALRFEKSSWNTPCVAHHNGKTQVIVNGTNRARAYDANDGKVIWEVGGMTVNAIPSPLVSNGMAYIMSGYNGAAAVAVPLDSKGDLGTNGPVKWRYGKSSPYVPSPILVNERLYFTKGNTQLLTVLNATNGKPIITEERLPGVNQFYSSPIAAEGRIYFVDRKGTTVVIKDSDQLEILATNPLNDSVDASPVVCGKTLYLRGEKYLYAFEEK